MACGRQRGHDETVTNTGMVGIGRQSAALEVSFAPRLIDVRSELRLEAPRRRVFDALLHLSAWWPHRVRRGTAIVLEPRVGGRFFENCDDGCGLLLGHVSRLVMPDEFAIEGSLGIDGPVTALWSVRLDAGGPHTLLHGRLRAFGAMEEQARDDTVATWDATYAALAHYLDA